MVHIGVSGVTQILQELVGAVLGAYRKLVRMVLDAASYIL